MSASLARRISEAYRWHRRLGARVVETPCCSLVVDTAKPDVWDLNHADEITAETSDQIEAVFAAMDEHLGHSRWRVVHTDGFTSDGFLARLAFEDYRERPATIQMALEANMILPGAAVDIRAVEREADWAALAELVFVNHDEGRTTGGLEIPREVSAGMVAAYRAKAPSFRFHLAYENDEAIGFGACGVAPNGVGMIEDLFTLPAHRRKGVASAVIAAFVERLSEAGSDVVFLGALAEEAPKRLYARLGFQPVGLARAWVKDTLKSAR